jgi:DNA helicase-2/ATP-dependent DNA helicase PcrA
LDIYESEWIDDWYVSKKELKEKKELGREILSDFYAKIKDKGEPNVLHLEFPFSFQVGKYTLKGVIDRIDGIEYNKIRLVDYKTGNPKKTEDLKFEDKEQLFIYQMAARELFRQEVGELSFVYLNNNSEVSFLGTNKDFEKMEDRIVKIIEAIGEGKFEPKPNEFSCQYCDFKNICQFKK